ncbi:MAG: helix-turn-helix transcriptional regulator [Erysipelotrichaceae bacterium]|nr:helix-turn-helix transcriptional regulator [Erysipelotrichaceae bacterium]MDY5251491.1 helix-turn-helix transcriptional regulator [Erysipelotrichaceae bacterium]
MELCNRVKEFRARLDINQQELGKMVNVSRQTISLIERGDYNPSISLALKIAKVFNVSCDELFYLKEENEDEK